MSNRDEFLAEVLHTLSNNPTVGDLDFLVEAYTKVGYYAAEAEGLAEVATNARKTHEADAYLTAKRSGDKITDRMADSIAAVQTKTFRDAEAEANTKARKLRNLLGSIEQAINAQKYLGRMAG